MQNETRIRETKHLSTDANSSTNTKKNPASTENSHFFFFFAQQFYTLYKQKYSNLRPLFVHFPPKDSENLNSLDIGHWEVGTKRRFNGLNKWTKFVKDYSRHGNSTPFMSKICQIWDHFFLIFSPKDSKNLKSLDIGLWEVGAKRPLDGVRNTNAN